MQSWTNEGGDLGGRDPAHAMEALRAEVAEDVERRVRVEARATLQELLGFAHAVVVAENVETVYEAAMSAVASVLGARRSAVLTFDAQGVMRFRAWRQLSDAYRSAVDGHSPWSPETSAPSPVLVTDAARDASLAAYAPLFAAEGIGALAFIPLVTNKRLIGKLMVYYDAPREFSAHDVEAAWAIANHLASVIVRFAQAETLAQDLDRRTQLEAALRERMAELAEADRRKDEYLATLAHELRNPLAPIRNAVQIMKLQNAHEPRLAWSLEVIDRQAHHMTRMLDDLLDVARIARDKLELRKEPVAIREVIGAALETSRPLIEAGHHTLSLHVPDEPIWVEGDSVRLAQIFSNLLNNAAKYTPDRGRIDVEAKRVDGDAVAIVVRDDGIGIEPNALPHVFEMFAQAKPALRRAQGGLGIGLSLVKGLVALHGGTLSATSEGAQRGTELVVRLPTVSAPDFVPTRRRDLRLAKQRVLIVDDNVDSAETVAVLLELVGSDVKTAFSGQEALEVAAQLEPAVMLIDLGMPGVDGFDVCRWVRAQPWGRDVVLIAMTGWGQVENRRQTKEAGFDAHLVKPIDFRQLTELIAAIR